MLSNSESLILVEGWSERARVSCVRMRETTQTKVKAPKCWLSVLKGVTGPKQRGGWLRSSHPLRSS